MLIKTIKTPESSIAGTTSTTHDVTGFGFNPDSVLNIAAYSSTTSGALQIPCPLFDSEDFATRIVPVGVEFIAGGVRVHLRNSNTSTMYYVLVVTAIKS